jgi:hypothetical protein
MAVDSSVLDPPRIRPTADPKAYLQDAVNWHFSAETGSPHCLRRATSLDLDPQTEISNLEGLVPLPNIVDELRKVPVREVVPKDSGPNPPTPVAFERGGSTRAPNRVIGMPESEEQVTRWQAAKLLETPGPATSRSSRPLHELSEQSWERR